MMPLFASVRVFIDCNAGITDVCCVASAVSWRSTICSCITLTLLYSTTRRHLLTRKTTSR